MSTNILIVGGTGQQGGQALRAILSAQNKESHHHHHLRFITRNPQSPAAKALIKQGAEAIKADLFNKASLLKALEGIDRAFLVTDKEVGEEREVIQGITFIDAAKEAGLKHLVFTSVGGADEADIVPHFRSKYKIEKHLVASGLNYTILRPVVFMENFPTAPGFNRFMMIGMFWSALGWKKCQLIATEDIGIFAGKALLEPSNPLFFNQIVNLSAGHFDLQDYTAAIKKVQGHVPWFARYMSRGVRYLLPHEYRKMMFYLRTKGYPEIDVSALRAIHPDLLDLEGYIRKMSTK